MIRHFLDIWFTDGSEIVSLTRRPRFTPQRDSWRFFSVRGLVDPGPQCCRKDYQLENPIGSSRIGFCSVVPQIITLPHTGSLWSLKHKENDDEVGNTASCVSLLKNYQVKLSLCQASEAHRAVRRRDSHIFLDTRHTDGAGRPLPPWRFLAFIFFKGWVDPRATVRLEGLGQFKNPKTLSGIKPVIYVPSSTVFQTTTLPRGRSVAIIFIFVQPVRLARSGISFPDKM
jgi:hypothetical protein